MAIRPDVPAYHASLGLAWRALGRPAEAAEACAKALDLDPDDAAAHVNRGVVVLALGDREAALSHFRRAVDLDPRQAQARTNLGELLRELGRPDDALPHCQAAVGIEPGLVDAHLNLGDVLLALGRPGPAAGSYYEAYRRDPNRARAAAGIGLVAVRQGAWSDALDCCAGAIELEPRSVEFPPAYLAEAAGMLSLYPEVRSCCERILELDPDQAVARNALAWILQDSGRHDEAREHYAAAVRLQPEFATAHFNFGVLHEELGELADAEAHYRSTLSCEPTHATALARLCSLLRKSIPDADIDAVNRLLSRSDVIGRDRANLMFGSSVTWSTTKRGKSLFDAAASVERANALALDELVRLGRGYEPDEHRRFIDALIGAFAPDLFERLDGAGLETTRPVFIIGLPRSGTTLIEQVLASHPEVHGAGEVTLARRSFEELPGLVAGGGHSLHAVPRLDAPTVQELARRHERRLTELDGGRARRVIGKMPDNYFYLGLIALLFPDAVVIHCRRDLRDVALSCWITNFTDVQWANDHDHIASRFEAYGRLDGPPPSPADRVHDPRRRLRGSGGRPSRARPAGCLGDPGSSTGIRPASSSTAAAGRSGPRARCRCASRSIAARSAGGSSMRRSWPSHSRRCRLRPESAASDRSRCSWPPDRPGQAECREPAKAARSAAPRPG